MEVRGLRSITAKSMKEYGFLVTRILPSKDRIYDYGSVKACILSYFMQCIALEVFRSLNNLNPSYLQDMFIKRNNTRRYKNDLKILTRNTVTFGDKNVRTLGPQIWNHLLELLKQESSFQTFKRSLNDWLGPKVQVQSLHLFGN